MLIPSGNTLAASQVRITEIMYDPMGSGDKEFVELYNGSDYAVDMGGWSFSSGVTITLASSVKLDPGRYGVVVRNSSAFRASYPSARVLGQYSGKLVGRGETIRLIDKNGAVVSEVSYRSGGGWPTEPRNGGPSLSLIRPTANEAVAGCWGSSTATGGSPGFANSVSGGGSCPSKDYAMAPKATSGGSPGSSGSSGGSSSSTKTSGGDAQPKTETPTGPTGDQELQNITPEKQAELDAASKQEQAEDGEIISNAERGVSASQPLFKKLLGLVIGIVLISFGASFIMAEKIHKKSKKHSLKFKRMLRKIPLVSKIRSVR